jgi:hypothetical protein
MPADPDDVTFETISVGDTGDHVGGADVPCLVISQNINTGVEIM